ncbi:hypothetical protein [Streptomyces sp. NPDC002990]
MSPRSAKRCAVAGRSTAGRATHVTAPSALHQAVLKQCAALVGDGSAPAGRKAYRTYADRIATATRKE